VILRRKSDLVMDVWHECPHYQTPEEKYLDLKADLKRWGLENSAFGYRATAEGEAQLQNSRSRMPPRPCAIAAAACVSRGDPDLGLPVCAQRDPWCSAYEDNSELNEYDQECMAKAARAPACQSLDAKGESHRKPRLAELSACTKAMDAACDPPAAACVQAKSRLDDFYDELDRARFENALEITFPSSASTSPGASVYEPPPIVIHEEGLPPPMPTHTDCMAFGTGISCHTEPGP
jgi:hypothetical protein